MFSNLKTAPLLAIVIALGLATLGLAASVYAQDNAPHADDLAAISPHLADQLAREADPVSFLILLDDQLDVDDILATASATDRHARAVDRTARGVAIYDALTAHATRTQAPLRAWLDARGVQYQPFYMVNMIEVRGDAQLAAELRRHPDVGRLAANPEVRAQLAHTSAPDWPEVWAGSQPQATAALPWGLTYTNADDVWALGITGRDIVISSQDTGVLWDHNALKARYRGWYTDTQTVDHVYNWFDPWGSSGRPDRCDNDPQVPCDDYSHGSHTVGTMMGDGTSDGYTRLGMAPDATWIGCRSMYVGVGTPASFAACFQFSLAPFPQGGDPFVDGRPDLAAHIVNNSWVCPITAGCDLNTMRTLVDVARAAGQFVVASAGNEGSACSTIRHPLSIFDATFVAGAHNIGGYIATFSSRGPVTIDGSGRMKPDVAAPGVSVFSASGQLRDKYTTASGTSMAAPHVAGAVALLWSALPTLVGEIDLTEQALLKTATPAPVSDCTNGDQVISPNNVYGFGQMDVLAALELAEAMGAVEVTLLNPLGQPFGNQTVTLTDAVTGYRFTALTDGTGVAVLPSVLPGEYRLQAHVDGVRFPDRTLTLGLYETAQIVMRAIADYGIQADLISDDPARIGGQVRFAVQITNTGVVTLTTLPLTNTFDSRYLGYMTSDPVADETVIDGAGTGRLIWHDLAASFNRGLAPGERYDLLLTFDAINDTSALAPAGSTDSTARVGDVWVLPGAGGAAVPITTTKSVSSSVTILAPTATLIGDYDVRINGDQVVIHWTTVDEQSLWGFHLHRRDNGGAWMRLTDEPLLAAAPNPTAGRTYSYTDSIDTQGADAATYWYALELLQVDGATSWIELGAARAEVDIYLPLIQR